MLRLSTITAWAMATAVLICADGRASTSLNGRIEGSWHSTSTSELHAYLNIDSNGCAVLAVQHFVGEPIVLYRLKDVRIVNGELHSSASRATKQSTDKHSVAIRGSYRNPILEVDLRDFAEREAPIRILLEHADTLRERQRVIERLRVAAEEEMHGAR